MSSGEEAKEKSRIDGLLRLLLSLVVFHQVLVGIGSSNRKEDVGLSSDPSGIMDQPSVGGRAGTTTIRISTRSNLKQIPSGLSRLTESWNTSPGITVSYEKPTRKFNKEKFTLDLFVVNGVNLASYGFEEHQNEKTVDVVLSQKYKLFDSFNIAEKIQGYETWKQMRSYHRDLEGRSLIFYMDKIAQKRFAKAVGYPAPKTFALKYQHELKDEVTTSTSDMVGTLGTNQTTNEEKIVMKLLPPDADYVCKPSHDSTSSGVYLVKYNPKAGKQYLSYLGNIGKNPKLEYEYEPAELRAALASQAVHDLENKAADFESWALLNAKPGLVIEELYKSYDSETLPAYEVKTLTIWGRVYIGYIKRGNGPYVALAHRDGTVIQTVEQTTADRWKVVPDWMQWDKVVELAEHLGRNKDLFRADIFVGLPGGSPQLRGRNGASSMRIALSETEFHPTSGFKEKGILEEASRLWMAGYKMNIYDVVENTEVPQAFMEKGYLSEEDAAQLQFPEGDAWASKQ